MSKLVERVPKEIFVSRVELGRRLVEFLIEGPDRPGITADIASIFAKNNISIVNLAAYVNMEKKAYTMFLLADFTGAPVQPGDVASEIKKFLRNWALKVEVYEPETLGVFCDIFGFPSTINNLKEQALIFRARTLAETYQAIKNTFGSGGEMLLFWQGQEAGKTTANLISSGFLQQALAEVKVRFHINALTAAGIGIFRLEKLSEDELIISCEDLFESRFLKGKLDKPNCPFTRGYVSGMASVYFGKEGLPAEEVECIAKGDPKCVFKVRLK
ncbi:MAG: hypothetical protein DRJ33_03925 [Candidatus Methanomethylicota archaeon]|uniref:ACT domain-containing protein n=1 Tax=Thermoproteota archaeon TaxID=2056631 RepID=A0A497EZI1_9CREN|nr:MAG: hypothetical protein DRJ33_03925 [Candidatus Verstraetearchaeota archaeon]